VEDTLIRLDLLDLVIENQVLDGLRGGRGAVKGLVAHSRNRRGLVSQRLRDLEIVERRRADGPRIAKDVVNLAVEVGELGRVRLRSKQRETRLWLSVCSPTHTSIT
jgi:hypothetical protein